MDSVHSGHAAKKALVGLSKTDKVTTDKTKAHKPAVNKLTANKAKLNKPAADKAKVNRPRAKKAAPLKPTELKAAVSGAQDLAVDYVLAIDFGLENLATCVTNTGKSFIVDGRGLKSISQYFYKKISGLQEIADRQGNQTTKRIESLKQKRANSCEDYLRKAARYIVNYCLEHGIRMMVWGYVPGTDKPNGSSPQFAQAFFAQLRVRLKQLCQRYGIKYIEQEESYTSKASSLDRDVIPVDGSRSKAESQTPKAASPQAAKVSFRGTRVHRGLYQSSDGTTINADVNAAVNILRKSGLSFDWELLVQHLRTFPLRVRIT